MRRARWYILGILVVANALVWSFVYARTLPGKLTVSFLDVGQGDAVFVESPDGSQVLVDGGAGRSVLRALGREMGFFDRTLDVVIATHPDQDHIGGLPDVLLRYRVSFIMEPGVRHESGMYDEFVHRAREEEEAEHIIARRGQVLNLGGGVYLRILFPDRDVRGVETNDGSIVAQLVYGETEVLLSGDAPKSIEQYVVSLDGMSLRSDVLKVGHHGSHTSSDEVFVGWVHPAYAVISRGCGNRYGHPHQEVLDTLNRFEIEILDTCEDGTITFESDGEHMTHKQRLGD